MDKAKPCINPCSIDKKSNSFFEKMEKNTEKLFIEITACEIHIQRMESKMIPMRNEEKKLCDKPMYDTKSLQVLETMSDLIIRLNGISSRLYEINEAL